MASRTGSRPIRASALGYVFHRRMVRRDVVRLVGVRDFQRNRGPRIFPGNFPENVAEHLGIAVQLGVVAAADFAVEERFFRDDVALQAALDSADVGRGLRVDAAQGQLGQNLGGQQDGGQALFRFDPGVGGRRP